MDVGTQHLVIEAKIDSVENKEVDQIQKELNANPGKDVLLYAPGYGNAAAQDIQRLKGASGNQAYVVHNCGELHDAISVLGGP